MKPTTLLATTATAVLCAALIGTPAHADNVTLSFTVNNGPLTISQPGSADFGTVSYNAQAASISRKLSTMQVTDGRGVAVAYNVSATITAFTSATTTSSIDPSNVSYTVGAMTTTGAPVVQVASNDVLVLGAGPHTVLTGTPTSFNSVAWLPTLSVSIPASTPGAVYTATLTHSVA